MNLDLNKIKYILFIDGDQGLIALTELLKYTKNIICVIPKGYSNQSIIKECSVNKLKVLVRDKYEKIDIKKYKCDILISSQFQFRIFKEEFKSLNIAAVNIHASMLPKYRGRNSDVWALINDEKTLGITVHEINEKFDDGKILHIEKIKIDDSMSNKEIYQKVLYGTPNIIKLIFKNKIFKNKINKSGQDIYWRARNLNDSRINWNLDSRKIFLFIRALSRNPIYAYSNYNSLKFYFYSTEVTNISRKNLCPGTVIKESVSLYIVCGDYKLLKIIEYKCEQDKILKQDFVLH